MTNVATSGISSKLSSDFLKQYSTRETVRRYTRGTAGYGIEYLLDHEYGKIYLEYIERYVPKSRLESGIRLWEFGCGGGMNLLHLVSMLGRQRIPVEFSCGTDFSEALITAAENEVRECLVPERMNSVRFAVARNENLVEDGAKSLGLDPGELLESFDLVLGVNTIRYSHRLNNVVQCVDGISALLREGGICIVIDMNRKFPAFRSRLRDRLTKDQRAVWLPTLDEHASPFLSAGFEILKKENFCWIPHSAGPQLTAVMKALTPVLNAVAPSRAMRSLVIARKVRRARS
jgi:SAM-dependent methyltransferase